MTGEQDDHVLDDPGAYSRAELDALEAAGELRIVPPGTAEADDFDREMARESDDEQGTNDGGE